MSDVNDRQRRFAELVVQGVPGGRAYEQAGFEATGAAADVGASNLLRNPKVAAYIAGLRESAQENAEMTRDQMLRDLIEIWKSPPSKASMDNPLCEVKMSKAGRYAAFPDKGKVIERISRMMGWDAPQKHEVDVSDTMADLIKAVRKGASDA